MAALRLGSDVPLHSSPPIMIGVDVGQRVDPTTIVVAEAFKMERPGLRPEYRFEVRSMERLPIGTSYPDVGKRIAGVVNALEARSVSPNFSSPGLWLVVDATGVGRPVVDLIRDALHGSRCRLTPATFNYGERLDESSGEYRIGKGFLVSRLQSLFQTQRIRLPANHREAAAMATELMDYQIKADPDGHEKYGAFAVGTHDDLVTALGLATLRDPPGPRYR